MLQIEYSANWSLEWKQKYKVKCLDTSNSTQAHWKGLLKKTKSNPSQLSGVPTWKQWAKGMVLILTISRDLAPMEEAVSLGSESRLVPLGGEMMWAPGSTARGAGRGESAVHTVLGVTHKFMLQHKWTQKSPMGKCTLCLWELQEAAEENWVLWMCEQWCGAVFPGILPPQTLNTSLCCSFTAFGASSASHCLIYPQLLTALGAVVEFTEGWSHCGHFSIAFLLWSQFAEILLQIMGAVVVRFGKEAFVVLQKFAANKMIIGK